MAKKTENPVQDFFDAHPAVQEIYGTTDGYLFEAKQYAKRHADTLKEGKRTVETFVNPLFIDVESEEVKA